METSLLPFVDSDEQKGLHVSFEEDSSGVWKESLIGTAVEVPVLISYTIIAHSIIPTFVKDFTKSIVMEDNLRHWERQARFSTVRFSISFSLLGVFLQY